MNFKKISFSHLVIVCLINDLAMATSSHRRRRLDDLDIFFFECKCFTLRAKRDNITKFVESVYLKVLFRVPSRVETAIVVSRQTQFGVSMVWNLSGWHFGFVNVKGFKKKKQHFLPYPRIPFAIWSTAPLSLSLPLSVVQRFMTQISGHLLLMMNMRLQTSYSHAMKIVKNHLCLLGLSRIIWLEICICQKNLLNC